MKFRAEKSRATIDLAIAQLLELLECVYSQQPNWQVVRKSVLRHLNKLHDNLVEVSGEGVRHE